MKFFILLFFLLLSLSTSYSDNHRWCWTRPQFPFSSSNSHSTPASNYEAPNWGWCKLSLSNEKIPYRIYVETSNLDGLSSRGPFSLTLFGEKGDSQEVTLTKQGFTPGATTVIQALANNVGDVVKIVLKNNGNDPYRCEKIRIETKAKFWDFECDEFISCPQKCSSTFYLAGRQQYDITVRTSSEINAGTKDPIYITLLGTGGKSALKLLSESGYRTGEIKTATIFSRDVGYIYGVILKMTLSDSWKPYQIIVDRIGFEESIFNSQDQFINCPIKCTLSLLNSKPQSNEESQDEELKKIEGDRGRVGGDYLGGELSLNERKSIIQASCDTVVKNNKEFGPNYATSSVNFLNVLVQCPNDCYKSGSSLIFGLGIHPQESSICKSAIVDKAMPLTGGIIGLTIVDGLEYYDRAKSIFSMEISSHQKSMKSFFVHKVDNIDFIASDYRIINQKGAPSSSGRLEFRLKGVWGSVCILGTENSAVQRVCKDMGYKRGFLRNAKEGGEGSFCRNFNGEDYCAPEPIPIHYMGMKCEGGESSIFHCYREIARSESCSHSEDVVIECSSENTDIQQAVVGNVRLVDAKGIPTMGNVGRLEFFSGEWGSVCNDKFTDKSAHVACRQMSFQTGRMLGSPSQISPCSSFQSQNYCGSSSLPIKLTTPNCFGSEKSLLDCPDKLLDPYSCSHEQDVIVECMGDGGGDGTGRSQRVSGGAEKVPMLGKLPILPIVKVECKTKSEEKVFRGDPGSIFLVNCPEGCSEFEGIIWGTGVYTSDSSICKSAIHSGVILDSGGLLQLVKLSGLERYQASTLRSISSSGHASWPSSFGVTRPNSLAIRLSQNFGGEAGKGDKGMSISFIEMSSGSEGNLGIKPVFRWNSPTPDFSFNGKDKLVDTHDMVGMDKVRKLASSFSFLLKVEMLKSGGKDQTLLAYDGCGGLAFICNAEDELVVKVNCGDLEFKSGYVMPLNTAVLLAITYDGFTLSLWVDDKIFNKAKILLSYKADRDFIIGGNGEGGEGWNGYIYFLSVYDQAISLSVIKSMMLQDSFVSDDPPIGRQYTIDGRICVSACSTAPPPNKNGFLKSRFSSPPYDSSSEGIPDTEDVKADTSLEESELVARKTSIQIRCEFLGSDPLFIGPTGKQFRVQCPKECGKKEMAGNVFGSYSYTDDSSVCKSAIHSGMIKDSLGGAVIMIILNGEDHYEGSFQNGIQSSSRSTHPRSIMFKEAPSIQRITCDESARNSVFSGPFGARFSVFCPANCSRQTQNVFGDGVYSDDSFICQAAIHAGVLTNRGGEIQIMIESGQSLYPSVSRNGVKSEKRGNYLRSFRVLGDKSVACNFFKEKYNPANIWTNWREDEGRGTVMGPATWTFNSNPSSYGLAIRQSSFITGSDFNYGSSLIYKNFDCGDAELRVNVYMTNTNMGVIYFRYFDSNNFYALELNSPGGRDKIKLVKKIAGNGKVLAGSVEAILPQIWYRFKIVYKEDKIMVFRQTGNLRNMETLIIAIDDELQRGTVGVAVQGNSGIFFDGIETKAVDKHEKIKESRIWDQCLVATEQHRKKFCRSIYGGFSTETESCSRLHNFCEICCDTVIPRLEQVLNYGCWRGCVKESRYLERREVEDRLLQADIKSKEQYIWKPALNEKIDFQPKSMGSKSYFVSGRVQKIDSSYGDQKETMLVVGFIMEGQQRSEEIIFPSPTMVKCGQILVGRNDCELG